MRELTELRAELDALDRELVTLFEQRMNISREVALWKQAHGVPVLDAAREEQVLAGRAALVQDPALAPAVKDLYREIMRLSRAEQEKHPQPAAEASL